MEQANRCVNSTFEEVFQNVIIMAEVGMELKEKCIAAEKYLTRLKSLFSQANRAVVSLQTTSKYSLQQAKKLLNTTSVPINSNHRHDYEKLANLIEKQLIEFDDLRDTELENECTTSSFITEKIKLLESKHRLSDLPPSGSSKSVKCDIDEKYPESWSRDSSIDLNNVVNLPPVPEDVFTGFASTNKPKRSSSLSSLKSLRKIKLFLQRAETSDEEDISSDNDELNQRGDSDDSGSPKKCLGNITEETQDNM